MKVTRFPYRVLWTQAEVVLPRDVFRTLEKELTAYAGERMTDNHVTFYIEGNDDVQWNYDTPHFTDGFFVTFHDFTMFLGRRARKGEYWEKFNKSTVSQEVLDLID